MSASTQQQQQQQQSHTPYNKANANKAAPFSIDATSNSANANLYTTLRQHCLSHATTPPRHIRCGVRYMVNFDRACRECKCTRMLTDEEMELRVEASIHCMGVPVHGDCISTHRHCSSSSIHHQQQQQQNRQTISWDDILVFPCRWKDLTRDACITFNVRQVVQPAHRHFVFTNDNNNNNNNDNTNNTSSYDENSTSSLKYSEVLIGGTTLHLFNEKGLLRTGKLKLQLYPSKLAVPRSIFSSNDPAATPGLMFDDTSCRYVNNNDEKFRKGYGGKEMERADARWHAMSVLDVLGPEPMRLSLNPNPNQPQRSASYSSNLGGSSGGGGGGLGSRSTHSLASLGSASVATGARQLCGIVGCVVVAGRILVFLPLFLRFARLSWCLDVMGMPFWIMLSKRF